MLIIKVHNVPRVARLRVGVSNAISALVPNLLRLAPDAHEEDQESLRNTAVSFVSEPPCEIDTPGVSETVGMVDPIVVEMDAYNHTLASRHSVGLTQDALENIAAAVADELADARVLVTLHAHTDGGRGMRSFNATKRPGVKRKKDTDVKPAAAPKKSAPASDEYVAVTFQQSLEDDPHFEEFDDEP